MKSSISGKVIAPGEVVSGRHVRSSIRELILAEHPGFSDGDLLSRTEHNEFRERYLRRCLGRQIDETTELERQVVTSIVENTPISSPDESEAAPGTFGQRVADGVASFGGSWTFILSFFTFLILWIAANAFFLSRAKVFDPYPFILLNLILSCLAAMQAPIIMMSQNRQEEKDRERAQKDYLVNLKAEIEIRTLHEKLDHLMLHQQQELLELQKVQVEMLSELSSGR